MEVGSAVFARRGGFAIALAAPFLIAAAALPAPGLAATTTIGQTGGTNNCSADFTFVQDQTAPATPSYAAPEPGQITAWHHQAGSFSGQSLRLKVYRRTGVTNEFFAVGESAVEAITPSTLNSFSVSPPIQVQAGDLIGLSNPGPLEVADCFNNTASSADKYGAVLGVDPAPGTTTLFGGPFDNNRLNVAATLVTPDPPDPTPPDLSLGGKQKQGSASKVKVDVTCANEACTAEAEGTLKTPNARHAATAASKNAALKPASAQLAAGETQTLTLKVPKKAKKRVKKAFKAGKKAKATVTVTATDAAGNAAEATRKVKLKK